MCAPSRAEFSSQLGVLRCGAPSLVAAVSAQFLLAGNNVALYCFPFSLVGLLCSLMVRPTGQQQSSGGLVEPSTRGDKTEQ